MEREFVFWSKLSAGKNWARPPFGHVVSGYWSKKKGKKLSKSVRFGRSSVLSFPDPGKHFSHSSDSTKKKREWKRFKLNVYKPRNSCHYNNQRINTAKCSSKELTYFAMLLECRERKKEREEGKCATKGLHPLMFYFPLFQSIPRSKWYDYWSIQASEGKISRWSTKNKRLPEEHLLLLSVLLT